MDRYVRRIVIMEARPPRGRTPSEEVAWLCRCLGLDPEKDRLALEVFSKLVEASRRGEGIRSIQISRREKVTQAAVVYHINTFMRSGLIVKRGREYYLRGGTLEQTLSELEDEIVQRMKMMRQIANRIDMER